MSQKEPIQIKEHLANEIFGMLQKIKPSDLHSIPREELGKGDDTISILKVKNTLTDKFNKASEPYMETAEQAQKIIIESQKKLDAVREQNNGQATQEQLDDLWAEAREEIMKFAQPEFIPDERGNTIMFLEVEKTVDVDLTAKEKKILKLITKHFAAAYLYREKDILGICEFVGL